MCTGGELLDMKLQAKVTESSYGSGRARFGPSLKVELLRPSSAMPLFAPRPFCAAAANGVVVLLSDAGVFWAGLGIDFACHILR